MRISELFKLPFSKGTPWVEAFLKKYSASLSPSDALKVSRSLYQTIHKVNEEIVQKGLPSHLQLSYIHAQVHAGIFLKKESKPIASGKFIGLYTGRYELVPSDLCTGTSYAYDVAQGLILKKRDLQHVVYKDSSSSEHSIQTNAFEIGNFTRYINHSSLAPNVEAVVGKLPDGRMEILLFALQKILPGEQLLSNYGGQYWKALGIIPQDMTPQSYQLKDSYRIYKHAPEKPFSPSMIRHLLPLREPFPLFLPELETSRYVQKIKQQVKQVTNKQRQQLDSFEEILLEKGIPRSFTLQKAQGTLLPVVKEKLLKGHLIGALGGTFCCYKTPILLDQTPSFSLYLDPQKKGNFLSQIPLDFKQGNLELKLLYDKELDLLLPLLFARKNIFPYEPLSIKLGVYSENVT